MTPIPGTSSIVETLRWRALHQPARRSFTFVSDDGLSETALTYRELLDRASAVAAELRRRGAHGERVLLLVPPGEHCVIAIYACLLAGAVAVPAYPPRSNRLAARIEAIAADARPAIVLTTRAMLETLPPLPRAAAVAIDVALPACDEEWPDPAARGDALALLQYTSGSTTEPRGVMITHRNLQHNMRLISDGFRVSADDRGMLWLPSYHDMGLVGGVLAPPYIGISVALMPPTAFLQRPLRWLEAIARHRSTIAGGPNFGYDLCVARTTPAEREALDLSSWRLAFTGAEPVRAETLERFATAFARSGFRRDAFYPCYGLAEATLMVTGGAGPAAPRVKTVAAAELAHHRIADAAADDPQPRALVGCGPAMPDTTVVIADPETGTPCQPGSIGEIWVAGPSVATGYWNRPEENARTFAARLGDRAAGPFLRTGDLGALVDGELFVTGRLKDLLIINGRNHYAQDIEWTVERSHAAVEGGAGAAFSMDVDGAERLVVVQEVKRSALRRLEADAVIDAIRAAIAREHELPAHAVALVKPLAVPRTSSGKIQRHVCRAAYIAGDLEIVGRWTSPIAASALADASAAEPRSGATAAEIEAWLIGQIARVADMPPSAIDVEQPFAYFGLGSLQVVRLAADLEVWLGRSLPATLAYDHPTISALSRHLAGEAARGPAAATVSARRNGHGSAEPVAIIGLACRFPGAPDIDAFWTMLTAGIEGIGDVPDDRRADWSRYEHAVAAAGGTLPLRGGFLEHVDQFDPEFFGITPREAASIDPQQRLLLEVTAEALDDAGLPRDAVRGSRTGVFVGISSSDYSRLRPDDPSRVDPYAGTGNALSIAANRVSYVFDLRGPSLAVDTACSSSLVAVHLACESLRADQCDVALAGGVNLLLSPAVSAAFARMGFLSPDGRCKAFDARADGYVRGEGAGVLVLKPLARARADADRVYAVIRGSAVNNDGRTNGLTAPSRQAQEAVLRDAYAAAAIPPALVQYVEAHGTGTSLGDPIEVEALGAVLGEGRDPGSPCAIGSVKTNVGHLEAAAGAAGLIKAALALSRAELPPSLHFASPNPHIPFDRLPVRVQRVRTPWPDGGGARIAGVSSFGFGGTNAHVVLEQAPSGAPDRDAERRTRAQLLPISATSAEALRVLAADYAARLAPADAFEWDAICFTAGARRSHHDHRMAVAAPSAAAAAAMLEAHLRGERAAGIAAGRRDGRGASRVAFVFTGQGQQWWGMARELLADDATYRDAIEACEPTVRRIAGWSLLDALSADEHASRLHETAIAQPALVAMQVALAACWRRWGVTPAAVIGHSVGEIAAAQVAGVLTLDDALRIAIHRGRIMQQAAGCGRMAVVSAAADEVEAAIAPYGDALSVAAVNARLQTVISGDGAALADVTARLRDRGVRCHALPGEYAFHSSSMAPLARELAHALGDVATRPAALPLYATAAEWDDAAAACGAGYWPHQMRHTVRFADAVRRCVHDGHRLFVELGPHAVLCAAVLDGLREEGEDGVAAPSLRRGTSDRLTMLSALGALYAGGYPVDWRTLHPAGGSVARLPAHPWRRRRCWIDAAPPAPRAETAPEPAAPAAARAGAARRDRPAHPLLGARIDVAAADTHAWENEIDRQRLPFLADHRFQGGELVPGTTYVEMAVAAASELFGPATLVLQDIEFRAPLFLPAGGARRTQVVLGTTGPGEARFRIVSRPASASQSEPWTMHATGAIRAEADAPDPAPVDDAARAAIQARCSEQVAGAAYFVELARRGFEYGPTFRGLDRLARGGGESFGRIEVPASLRAELDAYHLHPALLDAGAQLVVATDGSERPFLPAGVELVRVRRRAGPPAWGHASYRRRATDGAAGFIGDVRLLDEQGRLVIEARGLRVRYVDDGARRGESAPWERWLYELRWEPGPRSTVGAGTAAGAWLILADAGGVAERLAARLTTAGGRCTLAFPGDEPARLDRERARIRPADADDLRRLMAAIPLDDGALHVVDLWPLDAPPPDATDAPSLARADRIGPRTAAAIVQALAVAGGSRGRPRLWLITRGAHRVGADASTPGVSQAPVWGLGRTMLQEHPDLVRGLIDLDPAAEPALAAAMVARELVESDGETQIALRGSDRYVGRLSRWAPPTAATPIALRADASYLITGGLGGLGLELAHWMADRGARRLILLGRTTLPARDQWSTIDAASRAGESIAAVRALEAKGMSIHIASLDVSDETALGAYLDTFRREGWPPIRGVVHAAGVVQDGVLLHVSPATMDAVFRAKVVGSWLLHRHVDGSELDFFVLFSSAAALLGSAGQGTYASANAFLDALAHLRRERGLPALSIDWGPWASVGMAAVNGAGERLASRGIGSIEPEEGFRLFELLLGSGATQVAAIPIDGNALARGFPGAREAPLFTHVRGEWTDSERDGRGASRAAVLAAGVDDRAALVDRIVRGEVARVANLDAATIEPHRSLDTFGIDSLMSIELKNRLERAFDVAIPVVRLLETPTVAGLDAWLLRELAPDDAPPATPAPAIAAAPPATPAVALRTAGTEPPFFLVHPGALDVQCYADLVRGLGEDRPCWVLQPPELDNYRGLSGERPNGVGLESIAASCVTGMRAVQTSGPYRLGGWSLGGVVAFEIARQLEAEGETVDVLVLFDAPSPQSTEQPADWDDAELIRMFASYLGARRARSIAMPPADRPTDIDERFRALRELALAAQVLPADAGIEQVRSLYHTYKDALRKGTQLLWRYRPSTYGGRIVYFRAREETSVLRELFPDPADRWARFAGRPLEIHDAPGGHYTLFLEPHASELARLLRTVL